MTDKHVPTAPAAIRWNTLNPYISAMIVESKEEDPAVAFRVLCVQLERWCTSGTSRTRSIVAKGDVQRRNGDVLDGLGSLEQLGIDQMFACVTKTTAAPYWSTQDGDFLDSKYELTIVIRCGQLLAVQPVTDKLKKYVDNSIQLERVSSATLEFTFLRGEAKSLWLSQVHRASRNRPKSKATTGLHLSETLDPIEDSNYAMGSARCELNEDDDNPRLKGSMGVTLERSSIWFKRLTDAQDYLSTVRSILTTISDSQNVEIAPPDQFTSLAKEVRDPSAVSEAIEVSTVSPDSLPSNAGEEDSRRQYAELLEDAVLIPRPKGQGNSFFLEVGLNNSCGGTLSAHLTPVSDGFRLELGWSRSQSTEPTPDAHRVFEALRDNELLEVYYASGHKYAGGKIWQQNFNHIPFSRWEWADFSATNIEREKPENNATSQQIHNRIGDVEDKSLFNWVVNTYCTGWLTCDDGSGEAADFFHISNNDVLSIIHVKAAKSSSPNRRVSVQPYEVVISQAVKNLIYYDQDRLRAHLLNPTVAKPACWTDGCRVDTRDEFNEVFEARRHTGLTEVVIVQPHSLEGKYRTAASTDESYRNHDHLRVRLLDTLLHGARSRCVSYGLDLKVIGSKT